MTLLCRFCRLTEGYEMIFIAAKNTRKHKEAKSRTLLALFCGHHFRSTLHAPCSKSGMTLIELIITLTIMAAVASIALVTLSDMGATKRYEETERRGLAAQQAVLGCPGEISRFFNDMGRYPSVLTHDADQILAELHNPEMTLDSYYQVFPLPSSFTNTLPSGAVTATLLAAVTNTTMGAGWRGPYLMNRGERFTDNWGHPWWSTTNELDVLSSDWSTEHPINSLITGIKTEGEGNTGYLSKSQVYAFYENSVYGNLHVSLHSTNAFTNSFIFLYVPYCEPTWPSELCEISVSINEVRFRTERGWSETNAPPYAGTKARPEGVMAATYLNVPVGIRKIWAYAIGTSATNWVRPQTVEIKPGDQALTLYLNETL
jgi:prepilin-type N-terminal cleavage/methylation domain-containing protein